MSEADHAVPRRTVLKAGATGMGAALLSAIANPVAAEPAGEIWSAEYWDVRYREATRTSPGFCRHVRT
jgi:hypothetical protein